MRMNFQGFRAWVSASVQNLSGNTAALSMVQKSKPGANILTMNEFDCELGPQPAIPRRTRTASSFIGFLFPLKFERPGSLLSIRQTSVALQPNTVVLARHPSGKVRHKPFQ